MMSQFLIFFSISVFSQITFAQETSNDLNSEDMNALNSCLEGIKEAKNDMPSDYEEIIITRLRNTLLKSNTFDIEKLCILPNKYQWGLAIELSVINMDSDPTDICSIAMYCAIRCTKLPLHTLLKGESGKYEDFEINSNLSESYPIPLLHPVPICLTAYKVSVYIYEHTIIFIYMLHSYASFQSYTYIII